MTVNEISSIDGHKSFVVNDITDFLYVYKVFTGKPVIVYIMQCLTIMHDKNIVIRNKKIVWKHWSKGAVLNAHIGN